MGLEKNDSGIHQKKGEDITNVDRMMKLWTERELDSEALLLVLNFKMRDGESFCVELNII